jgi:hypothetical protein
MQPAAWVHSAKSRLASLSSPTLFLCLVGLVLPNALSLGALVMDIGAPPRTAAIVAYATVALIARIVSWPLTVVLYVAVAVYDAVSTIALLFNLAPGEVGVALHLIAELNLFASPLYITLTLLVGGLIIANIAVLTMKRDLLRRGSPAVLMSAAIVFAAADFLANTSAHYHFGTLYGAGQPIDSATGNSGFNEAMTTAGGRNVLVVVVEALGHFADPAQQAFLLKSFDDPALRSRYDVSTGLATYYGSTTAAELRELCHTREPYDRVIDGLPLDCLPQRMGKLGYHTVAMHGFTGKFFERELWYPKLGFERRIFGEDLLKTTHRLCGGPFRGPCDVDLIPVIAQELQKATQPTFFYWLTLSTHVPIAPREGTPQLDCDHGGGPMHHVEVCNMTEMWSDVMSGLARMTADIPPTDILIIGDHAPPIWSKAGRRLFTPGKVTWVRLTPRVPSHLSALPEHALN